PFSATFPGGSTTSYNGSPCDPSGTSASVPACGTRLGAVSNFTASPSIFQLSSTLNASIATALSVIPVASPASGVITKLDPTTGAELPASSTLGPIFTERGETI